MALNKLLLFQDFINEELYRVLTNVSGSGKTKETETILDHPSSPKSTGSGILLRKQLADKEMLDIVKSIEDVPGERKNDKLSVIINNLEFLKYEEARLGKLYCEYCKKGPLKIYSFDYSKIVAPINNKNFRKVKFNNKFNKNDGATTDHKDPISKGGDKFDYSNLAVCCSNCNQRKGDMSYDNWINMLKKNKKINESTKSKSPKTLYKGFRPFPLDIQEEICDFIGNEVQKASFNRLVYLENFVIQLYNMDRHRSYEYSDSAGYPDFSTKTIFVSILFPITNSEISLSSGNLYIVREFAFNFNGDLVINKNTNYRGLSEGKLKIVDKKLDLTTIKNYLSNANIVSYIKDAITDLE